MGPQSRYEIRIAGFGGQGVVTIGKLLGTAFSVYSDKNSVNTQSYGPESRGGACRSEIVVSNGEINYPYVRAAEVFIALSQLAYDAYINQLKDGGILIIDPDTVKIAEDSRYLVYRMPLVKIADEAGNVKYLNSVALGGLSALIGDLLPRAALVKAIEAYMPPRTVKGNLLAFEKGRSYVMEHYSEAY